MTAVPDLPAAPPAPDRPRPPSAVRQRAGAAPRPAFAVPAAAVMILAALAVGFAADLTLLGNLRHYRDQRVAYAALRASLAAATTPVGQVDVDGNLVQPGTPMALLEIPQLGISEVVLEGTTSQVLMSGPGHRRDTPLPGQAGVSVITGRQAAYGGPFRDLRSLRPGMSFAVTTGQGRQQFRVIAVRRAGDPLAPTLQPGRSRLTLITGDGAPYQPTDLLRIDADLISDVQPAVARILGPSSLAAGERPGEPDTAALVPILLWAQALLGAVLAMTWLRSRWGRWQTWVAGVPVLVAVGLALADQAARLLPNIT